MGAFPNDLYYKWHTFIVPSYVAVRLFYYRAKGMHYYLFDFCYWANIIMILFLNFYPKNLDLLLCSYFWAHGPLAVIVGALRNSMVFHKVDNLTSLAIHALPIVTMFNLRWTTMEIESLLPEDQRVFVSLPAEGIPFLRHFIYPVGLYFFWAFFYYIKMFVVSSKRI